MCPSMFVLKNKLVLFSRDHKKYVLPHPIPVPVTALKAYSVFIFNFYFSLAVVAAYNMHSLYSPAVEATLTYWNCL